MCSDKAQPHRFGSWGLYRFVFARVIWFCSDAKDFNTVGGSGANTGDLTKTVHSKATFLKVRDPDFTRTASLDTAFLKTHPEFSSKMVRLDLDSKAMVLGHPECKKGCW